MSNLTLLSNRIEAAEGADSALDMEISQALDIWWIPGNTDCPGPWTASLDAAMTLAVGLERFGGASGMLREAMDRLFRKFDLHMCRWPENEPYAEWLARYFTAACLRALAHQGEGDV